MKKIILIFILFFIYTVKVNASYIVMNMDNGDVLYQSEMNKKMLIASITKVMTAYVVINNNTLTDMVEVGDEIDLSHGSSMYLEKGEVLSVEDLLYGLLLRSGNDAAITLASYVSPSIDEFVELMNI